MCAIPLAIAIARVAPTTARPGAIVAELSVSSHAVWMHLTAQNAIDTRASVRATPATAACAVTRCVTTSRAVAVVRAVFARVRGLREAVFVFATFAQGARCRRQLCRLICAPATGGHCVTGTGVTLISSAARPIY